MVIESTDFSKYTEQSETLLESLQNNWKYIKSFFNLEEELLNPEIDPNVFNVVKNIITPKTCDRCYETPPKIRVFDRKTGIVEFICYNCEKSDANLRYLEVGVKS